MAFDDYLRRVKDGQALDRAEAAAFLTPVLDDVNLPETTIAEALKALTKKTVTVDEVCGFVDAMRARMTKLPYDGPAIDTCGTGGDQLGTFNISTAAAILLAAGGLPVAKHGNRAATSRCGSADVLEALHIPVDLDPPAAAKTLSDQKFVFLFAQKYHPALKRLVGVRKQLGFPTVFNLLGPLLNPAGVKRQVVGTFSEANAELLAEVMCRLGYEHALVVNSDNGLDEAALDSAVNLFEIKGQTVTGQRFKAQDFGLAPAGVAEIQGGPDAATSARIIVDCLQPAKSADARQRIVILNAGLGFYVAGQADSLQAGVQKAAEVLASGQVAAKLEALRGRP